MRGRTVNHMDITYRTPVSTFLEWCRFSSPEVNVASRPARGWTVLAILLPVFGSASTKLSSPPVKSSP